MLFVSNNRNVEGIEKLEEICFEKYLKNFPNEYEKYIKIKEPLIFKTDNTEYFSQFVHKVKLLDRPDFFILKGYVMEKKEYPKYEKEVIDSEIRFNHESYLK